MRVIFRDEYWVRMNIAKSIFRKQTIINMRMYTLYLYITKNKKAKFSEKNMLLKK